MHHRSPKRRPGKRAAKASGNGYDAAAITVLEGLEPVRKRPGMYIGGTDRRGLHHLVWEILDNAIDEVINGFATTIEVELSRDRRTVAIRDNGRGIPVDPHPVHGRPALELILTTLHAGAKFGGGSYLHSGGLHGVGASVVNALSESMTVEVRREGRRWRQAFSRGKPLGELEDVGPSRGSGTRVEFRADPEIFANPVFDAKLIRESLEDRSYLHRGLRIVWRDAKQPKPETIEHPDGLRAFIRTFAGGERPPVHPEPFWFERAAEPRFECAVMWTQAGDEVLRSYVNGVRTPQGGTHESALRQAVTKALKGYIETHNLCPRGLKIAAEDLREGLSGAVSVFLREPRFQGQTKERLTNPEIASDLEGAMRAALETWLHDNPSVAEAIAVRAITAARARLASREAARRVRRKSATTRRLHLPGKLADCASSSADDTELFIVEGDSAGGTAKQGRDRRTQAVLPLRGKVLNAEQASAKKLSSNKELDHIVQALGCGLGAHFDMSRLRYGRVILLMDADSDGHHITTLLITFFYRYLPELIRAEKLYIAEPPLYRIVHKKRVFWAADDEERDRVLAKLPSGTEPEITRFKGLGEMSVAQLKETTLDPKTRRLMLVREHSAIECDRTLSALMGKDAGERYALIMERAAEIEDVDV